MQHCWTCFATSKRTRASCSASGPTVGQETDRIVQVEQPQRSPCTNRGPLRRCAGDLRFLCCHRSKVGFRRGPGLVTFARGFGSLCFPTPSLVFARMAEKAQERLEKEWEAVQRKVAKLLVRPTGIDLRRPSPIGPTRTLVVVASRSTILRRASRAESTLSTCSSSSLVRTWTSSSTRTRSSRFT